MSKLVYIAVYFIYFLGGINAARILGVYPTPSISHQVVFRALTLELVKQGHEVVVITTDPVYKNKEVPLNLTEIDISESYQSIISIFANKNNAIDLKRGVIMDANSLLTVDKSMADLLFYMFKVPEVNRMIEDKSQKFDLIIIECFTNTPLIFGKIFDAPVILFSSFYGTSPTYEAVGSVARHPILYPNFFRDNFGGSILNKIQHLYMEYKFSLYYKDNEQTENDFLKSKFGPEVPVVTELKKRVVLLLVNSHPIFDQNRPVTPATIYLGALHLQPKKALPQDLKSYLDNSTRGVVYVSLGTNVRPSLMHKEFLDEFLNAFERIPFDILWKFDGDNLESIPKNVKHQKWFPQRDLLDHPNIKCFVMQGGLQSTDEAIDAEVPLVGIPMLGDQWYNANKYKELGIGEVIDSITMVADDLVRAVNMVATDPSYKENIKKLNSIMRDQPETPIERAVWWTEHVLRHKGSKHLLGVAAQISWSEYLMLDVLIVLAIAISVLTTIVLLPIIYAVKVLCKVKSNVKIKRH